MKMERNNKNVVSSLLPKRINEKMKLVLKFNLLCGAHMASHIITAILKLVGSSIPQGNQGILKYSILLCYVVVTWLVTLFRDSPSSFHAIYKPVLRMRIW